MDNSDDKGRGSSDKKPAPQGNNLVWYVLGFCVLLLLMSLFLSEQDKEKIVWSDLQQLIVACNPENRDATPPIADSIIVENTGSKPPITKRYSRLKDIKIGSFEVTGKVAK